MKSFAIVFAFLVSVTAQANSSLEDIQSILSNPRFKEVVGDSQISSIRNNGSRTYSVVLDQCVLTVSVTSICTPSWPVSHCVNEVRFDSSSMTCNP